MRDIDVRSALLQNLVETRFRDQSPLVIHELGLCQGAARIDIAVIGSSLSGYEIKSEHDTLERLPSQQRVYERSLDFVTLVCGFRHLDRALRIVPSWWGVITARSTSSAHIRVELEQYREEKENPNIDPFSLAQLLWREEALEALDRLGLSAGMKSKPRRYLWRELADTLSVEDLSTLVRETLKSRTSWRVAPQLQLCGD